MGGERRGGEEFIGFGWGWNRHTVAGAGHRRALRVDSPGDCWLPLPGDWLRDGRVCPSRGGGFGWVIAAGPAGDSGHLAPAAGAWTVSRLRTAGQGGARTRYSCRVERPEKYLGGKKESAAQATRGRRAAAGLLGGEERPGYFCLRSSGGACGVW